jgi:hypothetical protein
MIGSFAARRAYRHREIDNAGFLRLEFNLADDLTKLRGNGALLRAMQSGRIQHSIEALSSDLRIC